MSTLPEPATLKTVPTAFLRAQAKPPCQEPAIQMSDARQGIGTAPFCCLPRRRRSPLRPKVRSGQAGARAAQTHAQARSVEHGEDGA